MLKQFIYNKLAINTNSDKCQSEFYLTQASRIVVFFLPLYFRLKSIFFIASHKYMTYIASMLHILEILTELVISNEWNCHASHYALGEYIFNEKLLLFFSAVVMKANA